MPHREDPSLLLELREPAALCAQVREHHTSIMNQLDLKPIEGSAGDITLKLLEAEDGPNGKWGENEAEFDPLYVLTMMGVHVWQYLAVAVNHLAAAGELVYSGEYLYSVAPVVRASAECSTSVAWLLDRKCSARQFAARAMLDRAASFQQQIASTSKEGDLGARSAIKDLEASFSNFFHDDEVLKHEQSGGWESGASLAGEKVPGLEAKWGLIGAHYGDPKGYKRLYGALALLSHPNVTHLEILMRDGSYYMDPIGIRNLLWTGHLLYREALRHAIHFFGWAEESTLTQLDEMLQGVYPEAFESLNANK